MQNLRRAGALSRCGEQEEGQGTLESKLMPVTLAQEFLLESTGSSALVLCVPWTILLRVLTMRDCRKCWLAGCSERVAQAMRVCPRNLFVVEQYRDEALIDAPIR